MIPRWRWEQNREREHRLGLKPYEGSWWILFLFLGLLGCCLAAGCSDPIKDIQSSDHSEDRFTELITLLNQSTKNVEELTKYLNRANSVNEALLKGLDYEKRSQKSWWQESMWEQQQREKLCATIPDPKPEECLSHFRWKAKRGDKETTEHIKLFCNQTCQEADKCWPLLMTCQDKAP